LFVKAIVVLQPSLKSLKEKHPGHKVVSYINCSASIKALSDVICTSSNAVSVVNSFSKDQPLIFAPDKNLGRYVNKITGRNMLLCGWGLYGTRNI
jgi:quinolinate synthase